VEISTKCPIEEEATEYMTKTIPRNFSEKNLLSTTANDIKIQLIF
jgi:hypothetical protein